MSVYITCLWLKLPTPTTPHCRSLGILFPIVFLDLRQMDGHDVFPPPHVLYPHSLLNRMQYSMSFQCPPYSVTIVNLMHHRRQLYHPTNIAVKYMPAIMTSAHLCSRYLNLNHPPQSKLVCTNVGLLVRICKCKAPLHSQAASGEC